MNVVRVLLIWTFILPISIEARTSKGSDQTLDKFKSLPGREKVAVVFDERFHGRSLLFWRRSAEVWRTAADARLAHEEEILFASPDQQINDALIAEVRSPDIERARYAIFLVCLRARYVPASDFLVKRDGNYSDGARSGDISPFRPDLERLGPSISRTLLEATHSPSPKLEKTAKLYTFELLDELSVVSTTELANRWRAELKKLPCYSYIPSAFSEPEQSIFLLERSLASRGTESVVAVSSILENEDDSELRHREIEMLRFLDLATERLRRSEKGRKAILIAENANRKDQRYCGHRLYETVKDRQENWRALEGQFLNDQFDSGLSSWATLIAVSMDQVYGDHLSVPFERNARISGPKFKHFLSELTELDPTFPSWEFPSTATPDDMLHPAFLAKIRRYHDALIKIDSQPKPK